MENLQLAALVVSATEVIKNFLPKKLGKKYAPLLAIATGVVVGIHNNPTPEGFIAGLAYGLGASGTYAVVKKNLKKK